MDWGRQGVDASTIRFRFEIGGEADRTEEGG